MTTQSRTFYWTLILTISLSVIAIDSIIPAIPLLTQAYDASPGQGQLTIGLYLLGYSLGQIPAGLAADRYGRMPVLLVGMVLFTLMSVVTVLATSIEVLLVARLLQGVAGTAGPVLARAVARDTHQGAELSHIMAVLVTALAAGAMIAPIFGTFLVLWFGWQAPLVLNVVMGLVVIVMILRYLRETHHPSHNHQVWRQCVTSLGIFFTNAQAVWGTLLVGATFFAYFSIATGLGSVLVDYYGYSPDIVGWGFAFAVAFYMTSAQIGRFLVRRHARLRLIYWGAAFYGIAILVGGTALTLAALGQPLPLAWMALTIVFFLCGMGLVFANASAITLDPIPEIAGFGASVLGTVQMGLGTLGAALTALFYSHSPVSLLGVMVTGAAVSAGFILVQQRRRFVA